MNVQHVNGTTQSINLNAQNEIGMTQSINLNAQNMNGVTQSTYQFECSTCEWNDSIL